MSPAKRDYRRRSIDCYIGSNARRAEYDKAVKFLKQYSQDSGIKFGEVFATAIIREAMLLKLLPPNTINPTRYRPIAKKEEAP